MDTAVCPEGCFRSLVRLFVVAKSGNVCYSVFDAVNLAVVAKLVKVTALAL